MTQSRGLAARIALAAGLTLTIASPLFAQATFAPDASDAYIREWQLAYLRRNPGERYVGGTPWTSRNIAWSFVRDGVAIPAEAGISGDVGGPNVLFSRMDALFNDGDASTNDRAVWQQLIRDAFDRWDVRCGANFTFLRRLTGGAGDDPAVNNWDDSSTWGDAGPQGGNPNVQRGDIRIGMRAIDGPGGVLAAYSPGPGGTGDIILDSAENWGSGAPGFQFFRSAMCRVIGSAIGLVDVCPENNTKVMEPRIPALLTFGFPQFDDIRGAHFLYGDIQEPNDAATNNGSTLIVGDTSITNLSLSDTSDDDVFRIQVSSGDVPADLSVTVTPQGGMYDSGPFVAGICQSAPIDSGAVQNLQIEILPDSGAPGLLVNATGAGAAESATASLGTAGTYFIRISSAGGTAGESQIYRLDVDLTTNNQSNGLAFGPIVSRSYRGSDSMWVDPQVFIMPEEGTIMSGPPSERGPVGHGASTVYSDGYTGTLARFANVESDHVWPTHDAFFGRVMPRLNWTGSSPTIQAVDGHATAAAASAVGRQIGVAPSQFRGVAFDASVMSATVADQVFPGGQFSVSPAGLYYALFSLCSPQFAQAAGLSAPATVINSSWGGLGDTGGDGFNARAYDAAVSMFNTTIVVSAGNDGDIDNAAGCGPGGDRPGGEFMGARTVGSPATAYNVISVGAVGKAQNPPPTEEEEDDGGDDGGKNPGGGGGGGPGDPGGGGGGGDTVATPDLPLIAVPNFSSKGPADAFDFEDFEAQMNVRSGVHILAAGTGEVVFSPDSNSPMFPQDQCMFLGNRPDSFLSLPTIDNSDPMNTAALSTIQGTSFSAPTVAGAVALLQDVGLANNYSIDPLVMKAVILTGGVKLPGWTNNANPAKPQDQRNGDDADDDGLIEPNSERGLDFAQGAGVLSIKRSYEIYHKGVVPQIGIARQSPEGEFGIRSAQATHDVALTDPTRPVITIPDEPDVPDFPALPSTAPLDPETGLPVTGVGNTPSRPAKSPLSIARALYEAGKGEPALFSKWADRTDPDIRGGGGNVIPFDPRVPFRPPSGNPGPGNGFPGPVNPPEPDEIPIITVTTLGWDHAQVGQRFIRDRQGGGARSGWVDYAFNVGLSDGDVVTATLTWNRTVTVSNPSFNPSNPRVGELRQLELEDLNLYLIPNTGASGPTPGEPTASSTSEWDNVEHIFHTIRGGGLEKLRVQWMETRYDLFDNLPDGNVEYAIAWRVDLLGDIFSAAVFEQPIDTLSSIITSFGRTYQDPSFNNNVDFNYDGTINAADLSVYLSEWQKRSKKK